MLRNVELLSSIIRVREHEGKFHVHARDKKDRIEHYADILLDREEAITFEEALKIYNELTDSDIKMATFRIYVSKGRVPEPSVYIGRVGYFNKRDFMSNLGVNK